MMLSHFGYAAVGAGLPGFFQSIAVLIGACGVWIIFIGLLISGVISFAHKHWGVFAGDVAGAIVVGYFMFNTTGGEALLHSASNQLG